MSETIKIGDRVIGRIIDDYGEPFFVGHRDSSHFFRIFNGWGMSEDVLKRLSKKVNVIKLIVREEDKEIVLKTTPSEWLRYGNPYSHGLFEPQIILEESYFEVL